MKKYNENHQYLTAIWQLNKPPVFWRICELVSEYEDELGVHPAGFRRHSTLMEPYKNPAFVFDLTENKHEVILQMNCNRREPNKLYLVWRVPGACTGIEPHFKLCKSDSYGCLENGDSRCWVRLDKAFDLTLFDKTNIFERK